MRDVKPTEMTSWLCHLLFLDGQGLHAGAAASWTFALCDLEGALLDGLEGNGEVGGSFMCAHRGDQRCIEHWGQLMGPKSVFVRPWGQG